MPILFLVLAVPLFDGVLNAEHSDLVAEGERPSIVITTTASAPVAIAVDCTAGERTHKFLGQELSSDGEAVFSWPRDPKVTSAECAVRLLMANGLFKGETFTVNYGYEGALTVEAASAKVDVKRRVFTVEADGRVQSAEVVARGADGAELYRVPGVTKGGPGPVTVRWEGSADGVKEVEVVLTGPGGVAKAKARG